MSISYEDNQKDRVPFEHYKALFRQCDPAEVEDRTGVPYDAETQRFRITLMNKEYWIHFPDYEISCVNEEGYPALLQGFGAKILIIRYLLEGRQAGSRGNFLTYREMPWGEVYNQQFTGRCIKRLAFSFGFKLDSFKQAMEKLGAVPVKMGDAAYELEFMPGLLVRYLIWEGDEEFPPSAQILFSDNFPFAFMAEDMAVVGDVSISAMKALSA